MTTELFETKVTKEKKMKIEKQETRELKGA